MQVECYLCISNDLFGVEVQTRARAIQARLKQKEAEIEDRLRAITIAARTARLDEIEKELGM